MPKLQGVNHLRAVKVFEKLGFRVIRQGKHISMAKNGKVIIIPRSNLINAYTMAGIIKDAGFTINQFQELL
ncbi:type II toxin-antitoxin system HicA family toxin [Geminocystis herdmanii]|uniref:type II toxin-antitoxin system HicA family toxin n=1 Tax=Geminocystis herdmanii TaxID=669359 RepID=UPI000477B205|nr:type II toxin-antitoxin system HicA family toxin [Geminocystis herdmanii]